MDQEYTEMVNLARVDYGCVYVLNATRAVAYHTPVEKLQCFPNVQLQYYSCAVTAVQCRGNCTVYPVQVQVPYRYSTLDLATVFLFGSRNILRLLVPNRNEEFLLALILTPSKITLLGPLRPLGYVAMMNSEKTPTKNASWLSLENKKLKTKILLNQVCDSK